MLQCLLIDDSLTIQKAIKLTLANYDINVTVTGSLQEAMKLVSSQKPDFIISDAWLNGEATPEGFKRLSIQAHSSCLFLKGSYQDIQEDKFREEGFFHFLKKPFESEQLIQEIELILKRNLPRKDELSFPSSNPNDTVSAQTIAEQTQAVFLDPKKPSSFKEQSSYGNDIAPSPKQDTLESTDSNKNFLDSEQNPFRTHEFPTPHHPSSTSEPQNLPPIPKIPEETKSQDSFLSFKDELKLQEQNNPASNKAPSTFNPDFLKKSSFSEDQTQNVTLPPPPPPPPSFSSSKNIENFSNNLNTSAKASELNSNLTNPFSGMSEFKEEGSFAPSSSFLSSSNKEDTDPMLHSSSFIQEPKNIEETLKKLITQHLQDEILVNIKETIDNYCQTHFKKIAKEIISEKIDKLLEEKTKIKDY